MVLPRRGFVLLALAGCLPRSNRSDDDSASREPGDGGLGAGAGPGAGDGRERAAEAVASAPAPEAASGELPPHVTSEVAVPPTPESLRARAQALRERYGPHGLTVLVERPFVLVGDEEPAVLRRRAEGTVRWAVERLEQDYFDAPPLDIVEVWLLRDDESYRRHARAVFDDRPDTPYGYFTPRHRALIMNIATGGGTLVHELVHPYIESNLPECPAWFNEGLASLYEQCSDRDGHIWGLTNWRLAGLQEAIRAKTLMTFPELLSTTRDQFYEDDPGTHYAQARYLCYYLQEEGRLRGYYRELRRDLDHDPTGLATLRTHVGDDIPAFQRHWERWVLALRYDG